MKVDKLNKYWFKRIKDVIMLFMGFFLKIKFSYLLNFIFLEFIFCSYYIYMKLWYFNWGKLVRLNVIFKLRGIFILMWGVNCFLDFFN